MARSSTIKEIIIEQNNNTLFLQNIFDEALVGTGKQCGMDKIVAIYDSTECLNILIEKFNMDEFEALDYFKDVVDKIPLGDNKPIFIEDFRNTKEVNIDDLDPDTTIEGLELLDDI